MNILVHLPNGRMFVRYWPAKPSVGDVITDEDNRPRVVKSVSDFDDSPFELVGVTYTAPFAVWVD